MQRGDKTVGLGVMDLNFNPALALISCMNDLGKVLPAKKKTIICPMWFLQGIKKIMC